MPKIQKERRDGAERRPDGILTVPQADGSHQQPHSGTKCQGSHKYRFTLDAGRDPVTNKRRQRVYTFARLKDAKAERARLSNDVNRGQFVDRWNGTVSDLCDAYLKWACYGKAANTEASYRLALLPARDRLGSRRAQSVTREDIEALRDWMLAEGRRRGGKPGTGLSARSVRLTLGRLSAAFTLAIRDRRLSVNPCTYVGLPPEEDSDRTTWSEPQVHTFIATAAADRLHAVWLLSLLGLRRGEALGLRWSDISFTDGTITIARSRVLVDGKVIEKSPKSDRGYRTLPLFEPVTGALEALYARQVAEKKEAGPAYPAEIDGGYVAADELGSPLHPERYSDEFGRLAALAAVPKCRLHDCRHSVNSLLEKLGVPDSLRAAWLGHTVVVNRGTYLHSRPEELAVISAALGEIFKAA